MMRSLLLVAFCLLLTACGVRGLGGSYVGQLPERNAIQAIAADAAAFLAEQHAPGHTSLLLLTPEKDAQDAFSLALENALRQQGFTITTERGKALTVAYTLDNLQDKSAWYLQLRLSDGQAFARAYTALGLPEAGRSATTLGKSVIDTTKEKAEESWQGLREES